MSKDPHPKKREHYLFAPALDACQGHGCWVLDICGGGEYRNIDLLLPPVTSASSPPTAGLPEMPSNPSCRSSISPKRHAFSADTPSVSPPSKANSSAISCTVRFPSHRCISAADKGASCQTSVCCGSFGRNTIVTFRSVTS